MVIDRQYQAYYTKSEPILNYMVSKLSPRRGDSIFEPCAGDGVFIDKLLNIGNDFTITAFELNPIAFHSLLNKYKDSDSISLVQGDTLLNEDLSLIASFGGKFDKIIGNPPYGAQLDNVVKKSLKQKYSEVYSKESYTLFLFQCIKLLKDGGKLTFIIPDTFLSLHRHKHIREYLLSQTSIEEILLFPSSFFPGVNFGYANLSIITLVKNSNTLQNIKNTIFIKRNFQKVDDINNADSINPILVKQSDIINNPDCAFLLSDNEKMVSLINCCQKKIGDVADCVTGFYSGNDKKYLKAQNSFIKNAKKYSIISENEIYSCPLNKYEEANGIIGNNHFIPIVKGGNRAYIKPNEWFMNWSEQALIEYKHSKKCRFQNSQYYFQSNGIAIPMVRSSRLTAALIDGRLFDQSIVGIFPHDSNYCLYLLAFFNSSTCSKIISTINTSTNNSANYIKKIPFIVPSTEVKKEVDSIVKTIIESIHIVGNYDNMLNSTLDDIFISLYGL